MTARVVLQEFLDDLYQPHLFDDFGPNGLQVEGKESIEKIGVGVTASLRVIQEAVAWGADALIVHHGLFWNGQSSLLIGRFLHRVRPLITKGVSLFGYHLPMDGHPTIGNCWGAAIDLGLQSLEPLSLSSQERTPIAVKGWFEHPVPLQECLYRLESYYSSSLRVATCAESVTVQQVGICSGGAHRYFERAIEEGIDLFLSGTGDEPQWHLAQESGKVFVAAGHFATERVGPLKLTEFLQKAFPALSVRFFDEPNPF
ncbi:Nif3-like dinuclear metal center hexameric protein [Candidatus Similichlamydia laticola]|uniref:GTP cyclohydrolase 1 type 2 homolog n=1 Tax=Candidatus Similichlamydia laticola TaxID=2170265 RepID=A0A369KDT3_9BACT|nr:Nif3-like dinuclear metal center hexameric protein [Candidatus Similichlamydia laticola]RDB31762.1 hypothetical protein HAT2_00142 [Candidatus Similichlamydia laticola]